MTYDIVEKGDDDDGGDDDEDHSPLPSCWSLAEKHVGLDLSSGRLEAMYTGPVNKNDQEAASVRTDYPMPPQCGLYYYEITVLAKPKEGYVFGFPPPALPLVFY